MAGRQLLCARYRLPNSHFYHSNSATGSNRMAGHQLLCARYRLPNHHFSHSNSAMGSNRTAGHQLLCARYRLPNPHFSHSNSQLRAQTERQAVNFCVQGTAYQIITSLTVTHSYRLKQNSRPSTSVCKVPPTKSSLLSQ